MNLQSLISKNVPTANLETTVKEIEENIVESAEKFSSIDYIYILSDQNTLEFYIPIHSIFQEDKRTKVKNLTKDGKNIHVKTTEEKHKAALKAIKNNLTSIAVIDEKKKFVGAITTQDIFNIIDDKRVENLLKMGGVTIKNDNLTNQPFSSSLRHRVPWLIVGMFGGLFTASIFGFFEDTLSENIILAAYIPLVVYMADAVSAQMEAFIIRDLAIDNEFDFKTFFKEQLKVVSMISIIMSTILLVLGYFIYREFTLTLVIAIALLFAILSSLVSGVIIPYIFQKLHLDPADASGPVATIIQDMISVVIYFGVASLLL